MNSIDVYAQFSAIREHYLSYFDQTWFRILLEECPIKRNLQKEILLFLESPREDLKRKKLLLYGISNLEHFIQAVEAYMLPNIKELLGVSGLRPNHRLRNHDQYVHHRLLAEVLPDNISVLKSRVQELKKTTGISTPPVLPDLPVYRSA